MGNNIILMVTNTCHVYLYSLFHFTFAMIKLWILIRLIHNAKTNKSLACRIILLHYHFTISKFKSNSVSNTIPIWRAPSINRTFRYIQKLFASDWIAYSIQILRSLSNKMRVILRSRDTIETGRHSMYSVNLRTACGVRCKALCSTESMFSKSCIRLLKWESRINTLRLLGSVKAVCNERSTGFRIE